MSQKTNPTVIGAFVLVGIGLALGAVLILSSGNLFRETYPYVMVFDGDVSGLLPGAPLQYRGVTIGQVKEIKLVVNRTEQNANVPVIVEIDPSLIHFIGKDDHDQEVKDSIQEGLRGQLETQSLVTGLKKVMLVDRPDVPVVMRNMLQSDLIEIPTCPTAGESLIQDLQSLPLKEIVQETYGTLRNLNAITASLAEEETIASTRQTLESIQKLSASLDETLPILTKEVTSSLESMRSLASDFQPVGKSMSEELPGIIDGLEDNMAGFFELQENLNKTMGEIQLLLNRNSTSRYQLADSLTKFTELAVKASQLLDYLERHPESILTGKPE